MDDSCAVCAESLEWVAYGACGHRDVCSTCVARLRFVCDDRRCCICKSESDVVFVTKAMGDYTRVINDFAVLPAQGREGRVGAYWYHEGVQAFFDDVDHYKMIKAMCRLSCGVCDKMDGQQQQQPNNGGKRPLRFRNIEQLKGHLFHRHKLFMCSLCLEGRKIFICEQKLYTRAQLNRHVSTGDSEVDGSESERGGFAGHPKCEFCRTPFYGDNELYTHMSTEHFTCHICQRQHPGQYEYYKNYDDLEMHFRGDHFLCEDEACLEKKFIVFQSEAELKRHNTMEHGGRMSRSKRNAALQIPTSFRYRRSNEQDRHRGRRQTFRPDFSDDQLSMAIEASLETANADGRAHDPAAPPSNSGTQATGGDAESIDTLIQPFDSLATSNTESSARYLQALGHSSRKAPMEESSFPPLPLVSSSSQQKSNYDSEGYPSGSMADRLRRKNKVSIVNASRASPVTNNGPAMPVGNSAHSWPTPSTASCVVNAGPSGGPSNSAQYSAESAVPHGPSDGPSRIWGNSRINHSASSPNIIAGTGSSTVSMSDFPPVAATQVRKVASSQSLPVVQDVQTANKSLVEKIRESLGYDEDKYSTFKVISAEYRQGSIDTQSYLAYVWQFGLWHLVLDLARLCPDNEKQKELVDTYNASLGSTAPQQNDWGSEQLKSNQRSRKGKGKVLNVRENNSKDALADSIISTVRKLQSSYNPADEQTEELSKDGYRATKGKAKLSEEQPLKLGSDSLLLAKSSDRDAVSSSAAGGSSQSSGAGGGSSKQRKKTSKFHRVRLGDGSVAAFLDLQSSNAGSASDGLDEMQAGNKVPTGGLPVRGAWRTGGSHKLFS